MAGLQMRWQSVHQTERVREKLIFTGFVIILSVRQTKCIMASKLKQYQHSYVCNVRTLTLHEIIHPNFVAWCALGNCTIGLILVGLTHKNNFLETLLAVQNIVICL